MKFKNKFIKISLFIFFIAACLSCEQAPKQPKPSTYLRLDVNKSEYIKFDTLSLPFSFEYPMDCSLQTLSSKEKSMKWFNINAEEYNFEINVSYFSLHSKNDLQAAIDDCFKFLDRHKKLSAGIVQQDYKNEALKVYGTAFEIKGRDVVSPYQFYLTDSTKHFIRFALNNKTIPNNDSIAPVVKRLKEDMRHIINTFRWKE
ncbi:MAG: hypothetical protein IJ748_00590 [Bacteroidales bacterium]|nr:hypothetical protein [Bacteroidales bacterium]